MMKKRRKAALTVVLLVLVPLLCFLHYRLLHSFHQASTFIAAAPSSFISEASTRRPSSSPSSSPTSAPRPLGAAYVARLPWHHLSHNESFRVVSVIADHRVFPSNLPSDLRKQFTFPDALAAADGRSLHVFQALLAVHHRVFDPHAGAEVTNRTFRSAQLQWRDGGSSGGDHALQPEACMATLPRNTNDRMHRGALYLEVVVRCAFLIDDRRLASLLDARRADAGRGWASMSIHAGTHADEAVRFRLDEVVHFPHARRQIAAELLLPRPPHGFPTAPWAASATSVGVVRASGDAARVRVAAVTSRFSWNADSELWLLWTLDVVGVDHVVIEIVSPSLDVSEVDRALARHPGVLERVSFVDVQIPPMPEAHYSLQIGRVFDSMVRWQADFDFVLVLDTDEFVQLFDNAPSHDDGQCADDGDDDHQHQRLMRVDVKTFIARREALIKRHGQVRMWRPHVRRSVPNSQAEPRLAELLAQLAGLDGNATHDALRGIPDLTVTDTEGKSLFLLVAAVNPFLHYNQGWPYPPPDNTRAFMLHVREPFKGGKKNVNGSEELTMERLLDQTRGVVPQ